jgi:hypothetical protein
MLRSGVDGLAWWFRNRNRRPDLAIQAATCWLVRIMNSWINIWA